MCATAASSHSSSARRRPPIAASVNVEQGQTAPRRIGTILVERGLIAADELALALKEQEATGRPLGEICVERFGLDRLSLADALAEQWEEMQHPAAPIDMWAPEAQPEHGAAVDEVEALSSEDELRVLLEEAQAARDELTVKTDELATRLAALETLVVGVTAALSELRPANGGAPPKRSRSSAKRQAAPAAP